MASRDSSPNPTQDTSRRAVVRGAAWSVPVIAAAGAAPALASSCVTRSYTAPLPATNSSTRSDTLWTVPAGVTRVEYTVLGAAGGGRSAVTWLGGAGALVTGVLAVAPGTILRLIVGAGGVMDNGYQGGQNAGGGGYGPGGKSGPIPPLSSANARFRAGSGGGGSAILVGNDPVVVAGGGGGCGAGIHAPTDGSWTSIRTLVSVTDPAAGGSGSTDALATRQQYDPGDPDGPWFVSADGGKAGTATTGGAAGVDASGTVKTPARSYARGAIITGSGVVGGSATAGQTITGGGVGAAGGVGGWARFDAFTNTNTISEGGNAGGGGGGGYTGGGGGAATVATWTSTHGIPITNAALGMGAGGGGGGSYIAPWAVGTVTVGTNANPKANTRVHGSIVLRYCV